MLEYIRKPKLVQVMRYDGENEEQILYLCGLHRWELMEKNEVIRTVRGDIRVGDYVVKENETSDDYYVCKAADFAKEYTPYDRAKEQA